MKKPPVAPPVYRPQPLPRVLQTKKSLGNPSPVVLQTKRSSPVAPPIFRPQQKPKVLQGKPKINQTTFVAQRKQAPVAPSVYRPGPIPRVLQTKRAEAAKATSLPASARRTVPSRKQVIMAQKSTVQRAAKPNSVARPKPPGQGVIQGDFWEYTSSGGYVWHDESATAEWYALGRKYKRDQDWFSWSVYKRKDVILREPAFAIRVLKNAFRGHDFVTGTIRYHTDAEWESNLQQRRDESVNISDPSFSGYTYGPSSARVVTIHRDREKLDTLIHELVHVNSKGSDFPELVGESLNEGITEYLTQYAMRLAGFVPTGHYRNIVPTIEKMANRIGAQTLASAYFNGDANILDAALERCGIDLAEICGHLNHKYVRLPKLEKLDLSLGPILLERSDSGPKGLGDKS